MSSSNSFSSTPAAAATTTNKFPSTLDQFLLACGESPITYHKNTSKKLTINEELILYKERITIFYQAYRTRAFALDFWKKHHTEFPILAQLAREYLSTPGY